MTTYTWPSTWKPSRFEMRIAPAAFTFTSPYSGQQQAVALAGELWRITLELPAHSDVTLGAAREAFFDRLYGQVNTVSIGHQLRTMPLGTLRDDTATKTWRNHAGTTVPWHNHAGATVTWQVGPPALRYAAAQLDSQVVIQTAPSLTVLPGDMLGLGSGGQLVRVMAAAQADAVTGQMVVEVAPRLRTALPAWTKVVLNSPKATFRLAAAGVPVGWLPGGVESSSLELIEAI